MLILRRRWEYWVCAVALHKIGAILIPGSLQLSKKDLVYRGNSAGIHTMICVDDAYVIEQVEAAQSEVPSIQHRVLVAGKRDGWQDFEEEIAKYSDVFPRPTGAAATKANETAIVYFRYNRRPEDGAAQPCSSAGTHCNGEVLAAGTGKQAAYERF